jgi:DNA polymerase-3 subunit gamma/tau
VSYVVLARKWRPQRLEDVLGQEHITRILTNAIEQQRIAHAFLFAGPRGVGKTSAARILAKALNCTRSDRPTPEPCGTCARCVEITEGRSTDVFEIDAASHTGVDNVREIIDNVRYLPAASRYKVYVIDEVHMLSTGAFNALLKTLEEPPPHVKFILATTDVHKVPVTILSRVQRYDFRRIPTPRIASRLSEILDAEGVAHDPSALVVIAREADGSMRDAQSLLEQVLAFSAGQSLDADAVRQALGVVDVRAVADTVDALVRREPATVFRTIKDVHERGLDLTRFADALVEEVRDLLVVTWADQPEHAVERPTDEIEGLAARARDADPVDLERLFRHLSQLVQDVALSPHPRFLLEIGLASLAEQPVRVDLEEVMAQLDRLETSTRLHAPGAASGGAGGGGRGPAGPASSPRRRTPPQPGRRAAPESTTPRPAPAPSGGEPQGGEPQRSDRAAATGSASEAPPASPSPRSDWRGFVDTIRARRPAVAASLSQVHVARFEAGGIRLECTTAFDQETLNKAATRGFLEEALSEFFGSPTRLEVERVGADPVSPSLSDEDEAARRARRDAKEKAARERPAVKAVTGALGGSIEDVRVIDDP